MGITSSGHAVDEEAITADGTPMGSPRPEVRLHESKDPIWSVSRDEAMRLLRVYEEQIADLYPVVSIPELVSQAHSLYSFMEAAARQGLMLKAMPGADAINDDKTNTLKLVLAIAMCAEGMGNSEKGQRMFDYVQPAVRGLLLGSAEINHVRMLALAVSDCLYRK